MFSACSGSIVPGEIISSKIEVTLDLGGRSLMDDSKVNSVTVSVKNTSEVTVGSGVLNKSGSSYKPKNRS